MWLDTGQSLTSGSPGPWAPSASKVQHKGYRSCSFYPTIQVKPSVALQPQRYRLDPPLQDQHDLSQSASVLHVNYGKTLDPTLMASDAFYTLNELFWFIASSYRQYLNMLEKKDTIRTKLSLRCDQSVQENPDPQQWDSTNIRYDRAVLEGHIAHLRGIIDIIRERGTAPLNSTDRHAWPRANKTTPGGQADRALEAAKLLEKTFAGLLLRSEQLLTRYRDGMNVLMNRATMVEANKSLVQAKEVAKLTKLAFVYIPLSFTASFFGMNLSPLNGGGGSSGGGNHYPSLWVWFAVSLPVLIISLMLMKWDLRDICAWFKSLRPRASGRHQPQQQGFRKTEHNTSSDDGIGV